MATWRRLEPVRPASPLRWTFGYRLRAPRWRRMSSTSSRRLTDGAAFWRGLGSFSSQQKFFELAGANIGAVGRHSCSSSLRARRLSFHLPTREGGNAWGSVAGEVGWKTLGHAFRQMAVFLSVVAVLFLGFCRVCCWRHFQEFYRFFHSRIFQLLFQVFCSKFSRFCRSKS